VRIDRVIDDRGQEQTPPATVLGDMRLQISLKT